MVTISHLKARESILELVADVLVGHPAHVEVTFEGFVSDLLSLLIDQYL